MLISNKRKSKRIVFRADGSSKIGLGHIMRCISLAEMLKDDFDIAFAIQEPDDYVKKAIKDIGSGIILLGCSDNYEKDASSFVKNITSSDIIVLDGYGFKTNYQDKIKSVGSKLVCIDDLHDWHFISDVIINPAEGVSENLYSLENYTRFYSGISYSFLRRPFLKAAKENRNIEKIRNIFISLGAADPQNVTFTIIKAFKNSDFHLNILLGSVNPHISKIKSYLAENDVSNTVLYESLNSRELCELMKKCELGICPSSGVAVEAASVGMGLCSGYTAENQLNLLDGLEKKGILLNTGFLPDHSEQEWQKILKKFSLDITLIKDQIANQKRWIDGESKNRFIKIFKELSR